MFSLWPNKMLIDILDSHSHGEKEREEQASTLSNETIKAPVSFPNEPFCLVQKKKNVDKTYTHT